MADYDPLRDHLRQSKAREPILTFKEISAIIGKALPKSANRAQFWANVESEAQRSPANRAIRGAGYKSFLLAGLDKVRFVRD